MNHDIIDKFSTQLKNVLTRALCLVVESEGKLVLPEHLLWALGTQKGCLAAEILHKANVKPEQLRLLALGTKNTSRKPSPGDTIALRLSEEAKRMLEKAVLTANVYGHRYVGTEHLLSGILQINDTRLEHFFEQEKIALAPIREQLTLVLKSTSKFPDFAETLGTEERAAGTESKTTTPSPEQSDEPAPRKTPALDYFGRDLTSKEAQSKIDPVIGREQELLRVMEILCRRTKNNPLLIGEPGVGKTAIVEGLAKRVAEGTVAAPLRGKRIVALDLALLVAGTMYRGEFEARVRQIVEETRGNDDVILFIDELHTIVGAGSASGSLDAANILKPALARGEIRCIGATTAAEFKKHIENDSALERRFQPVQVAEPTPEAAMEILRGVASGYETFHAVHISPEAIESAVRLSCRYVPDKQLPDKALDLLDEAAASIRVQAMEPGPIERKRLLEQDLLALQTKKRDAVVEERFLDAISLKDEEDRVREELKTHAASIPSAHSAVIREKEIAAVLARRTGIPLTELLEEEQTRLAQLEDHLRMRIMGQEQAVRSVAAAVRRAKAGITEPNRPLSSFLFLGPSGVGKTETAKAIADLVFQNRHALIRLDMSEYAEGFSASKLVGAPAGYVGYREPAKLTDAVKQRPYSLVLFDEIEKAHKDVQNLLLQILEEGELTDATGRKVSFRHTVVVLTSNVGLERFERGGMGFIGSSEEGTLNLDSDIRKELEERFRPELLNRVAHTCLFQPLPADVLSNIAEKQLRELVDRVRDQRGVTLTLDPKLAGHIAAKANPKFGARDIRRKIETELEQLIASRLLTPKKTRALRASLRGKNITLSTPR